MLATGFCAAQAFSALGQSATDGDIRLVNGTNSAEGRVEVYIDGKWGTVCDDFWDWGLDNATVACRQAGYLGASQALRRAAFGQGSGPIQMDDVFCDGTEQRLVDCNHIRSHNCDHTEDAGVVCDRPAGLYVSDASASEGDGILSFTVTREGPSGGSVTVGYSTTDGTAVAGQDYTAASGTLSFGTGEIYKTISVTLLDDDKPEASETFSVSLSGAVGAVVNDGTGAGTIVDNDQPLMTIHGSEGPETGLLDYVVTLSTASVATVTVDYLTDDFKAFEPPAFRLADAGSDFTYQAGTLTFAPGETSKTIRIQVLEDLVDEPTEAVVVTLENLVNAQFEHRDVSDICPWRGCGGAACGDCGTILDDDDEAGLSIGDAWGPEDASHLEFEVSLGAQSENSVTVSYATSDATALAGEDYEAASGSLTFPAGTVLQKIQVTPIDDEDAEPDETFLVTLSEPAGATIVDVEGTGTITDNDEPAFSVTGGMGIEGGTVGFTVTLSGSNSQSATVSYATSDGTAVAVDDYEATSGMLTFAPGDSSKTVSVSLVDDGIDEADETFTMTLSSPANSTIATATADGTITDNDVAAIANASGVEDTVGKLTFDVALNTASAQVITLNYATTDGTATAGSDYTGTRGTVTFAAGETTKTIDVPVLEDGTPEEDETFTVTLSDAVNATIGDGTGTGTIQDDDPVPASLSIGDVVAVESRAALEFPVMLSGERGEMTTVTVDYATANRTAEAGRDYTETTGSLTFAIDVTRQTIRVPLLDDVIDEAHEIFEVRLSNAMGALVGDARAEGTILDDDFASREITLTASPARVSEDDGATDIDVTATLDGAARTSAIEVSVSVAGSGNAGAVDFVEVQDFTITIAALHNGGTATFTLTPINDEVDELDETLSVTGMSFLTVNGTEVELTDDDAMSSGIALTADPPRVSEGDGATPVRVTATLDAGARTEATTVTVTVSGSGDSDAVDFGDVQDFTITFAAGDTSGTGTFTLTPIDDDVDESDETLTVRGNSDLPVTEDTVELADDDQPSAAIVLSARPRRIAEDGGARAVRVRATLDASARTVATTVTVSVADSGQPDAVDYVATPTAFDITIAAGATSGIGRFTVTPEDDDIDERDEVLRISGTSDLQVMPTSVTVTLADDEATSMEILLSAVPSTVSEGAGATEVEITATLDAGARTVATTVTASATGSGDPGAVDFAAVQDFTILIAAGATSGRETFTLTPEDDNVAETSETLAVVGNADLLVTRTSVTLTDDDVGSNGIVLSASPALVSEGGGAVPVTVTASLDGAARQAATTVTVSVAGSGNAQTVDFQAVPDFEITIAANAASGSNTFTLTPEDDGTAEVDETLDLTGTSDLPVTPTVVTLADDDDPSTRILLSAIPERVSEGDGPTPVTVTATLDRALRQTPTPVTVSVSGSGDPDAVDLLAVPDFALTIPANAASGTGTFTLTPEDDAAVEVDEQVTVSGASDLPVTRTAVTLVDDDEVSTRILLFLTVDPPRASEGDGAVRVAVTAAVDKGVRPDETRIRVSVAGGGDPDAVDFVAVPDFDIAISANARNGTATFTVVPEDDLIVEADETLTVSGVSDLPVTPATMELLDDDEASRRILLSAVPARVSEGDGPVAVTVTASVDRGLRQQATTVTVSVSGSGDPDAVDFDSVADFVITIAAEAPSGTGTFTLTPEDDAEDEADETLALTGASDLPVTPTSVVLADDDGMASGVLSIADASASESAGDVAFAVTLDGPSPAEVTVRYATADPSGSADPVAEAGMDYESVSGTLTFAPGESNKTLSVSLVDDGIDEPTETFVMTLSSAANATIHTATANGTILDNDDAPRLSIRGASGGEGDVLAFVVTLAGSSGQSVTVAYSTRDGTAVVGEDYEATEGVLTFAPGDLARTLSVTLLDDAVYEREENFGLELSSPANATLGTSTATGTIVDDDRAAKAPTKGRVLLFEPSADPDRQGFVRIINHSAEAGEILVEAVDDSGMRVGPVTLAIGAGEATHFNSDDLEAGSARKGLPDGVGPPSAGIWRLELSSLLDIEVLSYARTSDGFVTSLHDTAPATAGVHRVVFLNPGRNVGQVGRLRLINPGTEDAFVTIAGTDDGGGVSTEVVVDVPAGTAREWTAAELESGSGTDGALGDGDGKWRLRISSGSPVVAMSLIESPTGNLTNLSTLPRTPGLAEGTYMVPLLPSASDTSGRQGFVRVVNHSGEAAEVRIGAYDNTVWEYEALALAVGADEVASFNSDDLEQGNEAKGLTGSTGTGEGDWWLELSSDAEIEVLSYIRTTDGFLTSMHDLVPQENGEHRVVFFNPAKNFNQVSVLWLVNTGDADAVTTITGVDDEGAMPGTAVRVAVPAGSSRKLTSAELESGEADAIDSGALGDGDGKWRLRVASDRPILVVSLLENPTGHLTNLSTAPGRGAKP